MAIRDQRHLSLSIKVYHSSFFLDFFNQVQDCVNLATNITRLSTIVTFRRILIDVVLLSIARHTNSNAATSSYGQHRVSGCTQRTLRTLSIDQSCVFGDY